MDTSQALPAGNPLLDASGAVQTDVACRRCGYNLRGLPSEGQCPECGIPVRNSISGDLLRFADPDWVEKLARGIRFILWGIAVAICVTALGVLVGVRFGQVPGELLGLLGGAVGLYGAWLVTEPDPSGVGEDQYGRSRKIIRIALLLGVINSALNIPLSAGVFPAAAAVAVGVLALLAGLFGVIGEIAKLTYLMKLATRIPEPEYEMKARSLRWTYGTCMLLMSLAGGVMLIPVFAGGAPGTAAGGLIMAVGCFVAVVALLMLIFTLQYLRLLYRMGKTLKEQAALARQAWTSPTGA